MTEPITLQGVVHGDRIEIPAPPGLTEGQVVSVTVQPPSEDNLVLAPGIVSAFGILTTAEGEDLDRFLQESRAWQHVPRRDQEL